MTEQLNNNHNRLNILFIFPDQLGAVFTRQGGNQDIITPEIDAFANDSLVYTNAFTATPICTPFRGTLFTGRYASQTGIKENGYRIPDCEPSLAEELNKNGFHTIYFGKWHLGGPPGGNHWVPPHARAGFTEFCGWESHHVDHWDGKIWRDNPDEPLILPGHESDGLNGLICERLSQLGKEQKKGITKPFAFFASFQSPHPPCSPPLEFENLYRDQKKHLRRNVNAGARFLKPEWNCDMQTEEFLTGYMGEISHFDQIFGKLISTLKMSGLYDNTIIIFTSDHGEMAGCHSLFGKEVMYDESLRIPLIIHDPRQLSPRTETGLVSSIDLFPTILDLLEIPVPHTAEGYSLRDSILNADPSPRTFIYAEYHHLCIRNATYKLITDMDAENIIALFDISLDPFEERDIQDKSVSVRTELLHQLRSWRNGLMARVGHPEQAGKPFVTD